MTWRKRLFDLALAAILGLVLAPVLAVLLLALLLTSGRPLFYASERMHSPDRPFRLWKLRTMTVSAADSGVSGGDKAHRITPMGRFLRRSRMVERCSDLMERFDVRPANPALPASGFSGGNQQKLVIAREHGAEPKVMLVGQPTRGVDIGAIEFIHRQLLDLRDQGCAILIVSVELDEILALSDRIVAMNAGRIVGEIDGRSADRRTVGLMMGGIREEAAGEAVLAT